jgi:hypothetical protein
MVDQQDRFYREVLELSRNNTSTKHNVLYTKEKVDELIYKVLHAKTVLKKNDKERHLLKKFDVMQVSEMQKLLRRQLNLYHNPVCFPGVGSLFRQPIILTAHCSDGPLFRQPIAPTAHFSDTHYSVKNGQK